MLLHPAATNPSALTTVAQLEPCVSERDEFGAFNGVAGLFRAAVTPTALAKREDLGHALCAWPSREDLL